MEKASNDGMSSASLVSQFGNMDALSYLIKKRIDFGEKGYQKYALLHTAAKHSQNLIVVGMLLKEPNIQNLIDDTFNHLEIQ